MKKEIKTTEEGYFCDICGEQIHDAYWAYGGYATAGEETKRCSICNRDTCPKCREYISLIEHFEVVCKECLKKHKTTLQELTDNMSLYGTEAHKLHQKFTTKQKKLLASMQEV